jgi:hypothetical protein
MKWFRRFLQTISDLVAPNPLGGKDAALAKLDPQHIYLENVRSIFNVSAEQAQQMCDVAVRRGVFRSAIQVICPDGAVAASAPSEDKLPQSVRCWVEQDGEADEVEFPTRKLRKIRVYSLSGEEAFGIRERGAMSLQGRGR